MSLGKVVVYEKNWNGAVHISFMISMTACSSSKNNPVHLGVNAVITEIDEGNSTITVKDGAEEGILGKKLSY